MEIARNGEVGEEPARPTAREGATGRTRETEALLWGISPTDYHSDTQTQPPVWAA